MSVEIAWKQNILVTDSNLLESKLVVFGFGSQAFVCGFSRQNINSAHKGRLNSEWIYEVIVSTKIPIEKLPKSLRSLLEGRAEILVIFSWHFGRNDDFINSFWIKLPLVGPFYPQLQELKANLPTNIFLNYKLP